MATILTAEQVVELRGSSRNRKVYNFHELCLSHEALRGQLAESRAYISGMTQVLRELDVSCSHCQETIDKVMDGGRVGYNGAAQDQSKAF